MNKDFPDYSRVLSPAEINKRLHKFNLTGDYSVFAGVPEIQQVSIMYPSVIRLTGQSDEDYKQSLIKLFGPLETGVPAI